MTRIESGIYHLPLGADYPVEVARGLTRRLGGDPVALARVEMFVNSRSMSQAILSELSGNGATFLPRVRLVGKLAENPIRGAGAEEESLARVFEVARLISGMMERDEETSPHAVFETAETLIELVDEIYGHGLDFSALEGLDVGDHAAHWMRNFKFLEATAEFLQFPGREGPGAARRAATESLIESWRETPPEEPVILCGSTLSLSTTSDLAKAIAELPQGAVILPGLATGLKAEDWSEIGQTVDHPQSRFTPFVNAPEDGDPPAWTEVESSPRRALLSLALRPAPVTDSWRRDGPALGPVAPMTEGLALVEAPDPRNEALAIAAATLEAVRRDESVSIVTFDRTLARRVTAAFDQWGIVADESAGTALDVTAAGRLLRGLMRSLIETPTSANLIDLLKNPLCSLSPDRRGHLRETRALEKWFREKGVVWPKRENLDEWAEKRSESVQAFAAKLADALPETIAPESGFEDVLAEIRERMNKFAPGIDRGRDQSEIIDYLQNLVGSDPSGTRYATDDIVRLIARGLSRKSIPIVLSKRHSVKIVGSLQAREEQSDLIILGGLNEGVWPAQPAPDPWLSRRMREQAGLPSPDVRVGVEAHDFQNAAARPRVVLSRARRDGEAQTIPSRWLNRLTGLLDGLYETGGPEALETMRTRGDRLLNLARALDTPREKKPRAPRPCPAPPVSARPAKLPVTRIQQLIRDPYAIYARHVLRLRPLDPLRPEPGAMRRGIVIHRILEDFIREVQQDWPDDASTTLSRIARNVLGEQVPWPSARRYWAARIDNVTDWFVDKESQRREIQTVAELEVEGEFNLPDQGFTLSAKADRVDRFADGKLAIYDYKSGNPPTGPVMHSFDKQLHLEAMMMEKGAFEKIAAAPVSVISHIGLGRTPIQNDHDLDPGHADKTLEELRLLIVAYYDPAQGYLARRRVQKDSDIGDYDHLSRYGEWAPSDRAETEQW